jgi:uncharacterized membrane protein
MLTLQKYPWLRLVMVLAVLFWVLCNGLVLHRYYSFYSSYANYNQGIFDQLFWNGLHGRFFESSLSSQLSSAVVHDQELPTVAYQRLGQHFTPSLLLWLPLYALYPSPAGLSVLQTTLIAAAGLVLYALARHYHPPPISALIVASYYAAGAVISPTLADFRDFSQLPLSSFGLLLALEKRWWWLFWVLSLLTLTIREDAGIVLFSIGCYLLLSRRRPWVGLTVCGLSLGYILVVTNIIMPLFSEDISRRFMIEQFGQFVDDQDASTLEAIWAIASNPWQLLVELVTPIDRTLQYLLAQWLPLAFVPAISPSAWVLAGFPTFQVLIRQASDALSISLRYALTLVPGLFYGAILWWAQYPEKFQRRSRQFWVFCIGLSFCLTLLSNPNRVLSFAIPDSFQPWVYVSPARQWQHAQAIRTLLAQIPSDASVSATVHLAGHLSNRREILIFPYLRLRNDEGNALWMEYAFIDLWSFQQYQVAFEDDRDKLNQSMRVINRMLNRQNYGLIDFQDGVLLLKHKAKSEPGAFSAWQVYRQELQVILSVAGCGDKLGCEDPVPTRYNNQGNHEVMDRT